MAEQFIEVQKMKEGYGVRVCNGNAKKENTEYFNVVRKDPNLIALLFSDLEHLGFPIEKAVKIFLKKKNVSDWIS